MHSLRLRRSGSKTTSSQEEVTGAEPKLADEGERPSPEHFADGQGLGWSEDLAAIIGAMPAAVVLVRDRRMIAEVSGRFASVFGRPVVDLLGSDLLRFVAPDDASLVGSVIYEARSVAAGAVPQSVVARFEQSDGSRRLVEVSAAHRSDGTSRGATVVLLRPQSIRQGLNAALTPHVGFQDADEASSSMELAEDALETIVGVLGCEPVAHDCYFVIQDEASGSREIRPDAEEYADVPVRGPWDRVLAGKTDSVEVEASALPAELQAFAMSRNFTAVRCVPVLASHRHRVIGCLVAWDRRQGPISPTTEATFRYAAEIASLALGRDRTLPATPRALGEAWPSDVDLVTGLPLQEALQRLLDEMISSGQRPGLVCIRLSALDQLRTSLGGFTADQLLRVAARRVHSLTRQTDEIFRFERDGIVIVCTGSVDGEQLGRIGGRFAERLGTPFRVDADDPIDVGAVVTYLECPEEPVSGAALLQALSAPAS